MEAAGPSIEAMQSTSQPTQNLSPKKSPKKNPNRYTKSKQNNIPSPKKTSVHGPTATNSYPGNNLCISASRSNEELIPFTTSFLRTGPSNFAPPKPFEGNVAGSPRTQESAASSNKTVDSLKITVNNDLCHPQRIVENAVQNAVFPSPRTVQNSAIPSPRSMQNAVIPPARSVQNAVIPPPRSMQNTVIPSLMTMQNNVIPSPRSVQNTYIPPLTATQNTVIPSLMTMQNTVIPPPRSVQNNVIPPPRTAQNAFIPSPRGVQSVSDRFSQFNGPSPRQIPYESLNYQQRFPKNNSQNVKPGNQGSINQNNGEPSLPRNWRQRKLYDHGEPDYYKKVIVSGFPAFTKPEELIRIMSKFGSPYIEICKNRLAVVVFRTEQEAIAAVRANDTIPIYGTILTIETYTNQKHVMDTIRANKRVVKHEHKGPPVAAPKDIDLSGDFQQQIQSIEGAIRLTQEEVDNINPLFQDIETYMKMIYPYCEAIPFGSITTGQGIKSSDADCFLALEPSGAGGRRPGAGAAEQGGQFVNKAARLMRVYPAVFAQIVAIPKANTPIIKFLHVPTNVHCDLNSKTPLGVQNSRLLGHLLRADGLGRYSSVGVLLKYWARVHELSGTGRLTNYALLLLLIFYLQQDHLPSVSSLQGPEYSFIVENWNAGFNRDPIPVTTVPSIRDILGGFFTFYARFDFEELVVCPLVGKPVRKAGFDSDVLPPEMSLYRHNVKERLALPLRTNRFLCIQDPFELSHNVASAVTGRLAAEIKTFFSFAAGAFAAEEKSPGELLRTLLLSRPPCAERPLDSRKSARISLPGKLLLELQGDWRAAARDTLLTSVYKDMMLVELTRRPTVSREAEVETEAYYGVVSRPVWKRSRVERSGSARAEELLRRQRAILLRVQDAQDIDVHVPFEVELGFRKEPRGLSITSTALDDADLDTFGAFRQFSHNFINRWIKALLRPHLKQDLNRVERPLEPRQVVKGTSPKRTTKRRNHTSPKRQILNKVKSSGDPPIETVAFVNSNHKDLSESLTAISLNDSSQKDTNRDNDDAT